MSTNYISEISPDNNAHVYQIKDKEAAPITLLSDTVGWVGKNDLPILDSVVTKTEGGVTITVTRNSEGQVTEIDADTNGSPSSARVDFYLNNSGISIDNSKSYILSGCTGGAGNTYRLQLLSSDSSVVKSCENSEVTFNGSDFSGKTVHSRITIYSGTTLNHVKFYPMLRDASIKDGTYESYHKSVEDWYWENNPNAGVKNIMPINAVSSDTVRGVDYSYDKSSGTVSLSGTTSDVGWKWLNNDTNADINNIPLKAGKYKVKVFGVSANEAYNISIVDSNNTYLFRLNDGNEGEFTLANDINVRYGIYFKAANKVATSTFKIMIYDARDTNPDFQPHAMTNAELTEKVQGIINAANNAADFAAFKTAIGAL